MTPRKETELAARLAELAITPAELAAIVRRSVEEVEGWVKAKTLGGEAAVLLRFLADADDAARRVDALRRSWSRDLRSDATRRHERVGAQWGGNAETGKTTGGRPT